jgi:predicted nucleotidyltransferase
VPGRDIGVEDDDVIQDIATRHGIALIYIFGSQVRAGLDILGRMRPERTDPLADLDIGVVFDRGLPPTRERIDLYSSIHNALQDVFSPFPVDLVFLQETHSVFQANAICGHCIYFSSPEFKENYEESILRRAADFRPFLERYLDEVLEEAQKCRSTHFS